MKSRGCYFVVYDDRVSNAKVRQRLGERPVGGARVVLFPLTSDESITDLLASELSGDGITCEIFPFVRTVNDKAIEWRESYLETLKDLSLLRVGRKTLREHFRLPFHSLSVWWFSAVSEKNATKSKSYQRYVISRIVNEEAVCRNCKSLVVMLKDVFLERALEKLMVESDVECSVVHQKPGYAFWGCCASMWNEVIRQVAWWRRVRIGMFERRNRLLQLAACKYLFVTYFPHIEREAFNEGKYVNRYIGPLQKAAEGKYPDGTATLALGLDSDGWTKYESIEIADQLNKGGSRIVLLEECLTPMDLIKGLVLLLIINVKYSFLRQRIRSAVRAERMFLWDIWAEDFDETFLAGELVGPVLSYFAFRRLFSVIQIECCVSYIAEMYAWEAALNAARRPFKNIRAIALQHTIVSQLLLNYFESPHNLKWENDVLRLPLPDRIGCVGEITKKMLHDGGWPNERLFKLGALRMAPATTPSANENACSNAVIVALSYSMAEALEILSLVSRAFREEKNLLIYLKFHPAMSYVDISRKNILPSDLLSLPFVITEEPIEKLLCRSQVMIAGGTSSCLGALRMGRNVIVPLVASSLCINPLFGVSDIASFVATSAELRSETMKALVKRSESESARSFVDNYCLVHREDEEYLRRLEASLSDEFGDIV